MRVYRTIPHALVCDMGRTSKEALHRILSAPCIRLIHSTVNHPQTNGKLERAFRDDMNEFYRRHSRWIFQELQCDLPAYLSYRNERRGHYGPARTTRYYSRSRTAFFCLIDRLGTVRTLRLVASADRKPWTGWRGEGQRTKREHYSSAQWARLDPMKHWTTSKHRQRMVRAISYATTVQNSVAPVV